jgi:hypothetical protein
MMTSSIADLSAGTKESLAARGLQRFDALTDARPSAELTLGEALDAITDGQYAGAIREVRKVWRRQGEGAYAVAKRKLPQVTFAGTFHPTRAKAHLVQHSGIVHADIDHLPDLLETKLRLQGDPHVAYCFVSPRGDGLKYGVSVPVVTSDAAYRHAWQHLATAHAALYEVIWDPSGRDVSRLWGYLPIPPKRYISRGIYLLIY